MGKQRIENLRFLSLVFVGLLVLAGRNANAISFMDCVRAFRRISLRPFYGSPKRILNSVERKQLEDFRTQKIKAQSIGYSFPETVKFKGESYDFVEYLGSGAEGNVLRVKKDGQDFSLKFVDLENYFDHIKRIQKEGVPSISVLEVVKEDESVKGLLSYVHGVSVEWIRGDLRAQFLVI